MRILLVGAGAVGQVYALHLQRAGHEVAFFVKPKHAVAVRDGLVLHRLGHRGHVTESLRGFGVVTSLDAVAAGTWDQVWLAIASDALRGELATRVLAAVGDATVVVLQPDLGNGAHVRSLVPREQVVVGVIPFISFESPLPRRDGPRGLAYYLWPLRSTLLSGADARVEPAIGALRAGGLRARRVADVERATDVGLAAAQTLVATLEANRWDFHGLPGSATLANGLAAAEEAMHAVAADTGLPVPLGLRAIRRAGWVGRVGIPLAAKAFPFDLEAYLHFHFGKLAPQTRFVIAKYVALAEKHALPNQALRELVRRLPSLEREDARASVDG